MTDKIAVLTTCDSLEAAEAMATRLVEMRLAACVSIVPGLLSVYRWKGAVEKAAEWQLLIKTARGRFDDVCAAIESLHTYDTPEVIALPIVAASDRYLAWVDKELNTNE
jgi:periplasmic divalent cation tolerance protein